MHAPTAPLLCTETKTSSAATKLPSPEVMILTKACAASDENRRNCRFGAWAIWKHGHVDHPMSVHAVEVVIATTWATVKGLSLIEIISCCLFSTTPVSKPKLAYRQMKPNTKNAQWDLNHNTEFRSKNEFENVIRSKWPTVPFALFRIWQIISVF